MGLVSEMKKAVSVVACGGMLTLTVAASPVQAAETTIPQLIVVDPMAVENWNADVTVTG
ncbi:hypothetical protein [Actinomadura chokoriensis]|uniref:Uncharacterized protein n=1 Tax=Actinomadura chokoriensis TaxID=454156 RepID=A0ABV4RA74_9ACTN